MRITAETRTVVKHNHALITPDGFVSSNVPGWTGCDTYIIINSAMGAQFLQMIVHFNRGAQVKGTTESSELFIYTLSGAVDFSINEKQFSLPEEGYLYIPPECSFELTRARTDSRILVFQKTYEPVKGHDIPKIHHGNSAEISSEMYLDDPQLHMQYLLPDRDDMSFDMGVNIFTYDSGGNLPFVETHIMEHGLIYLQGQGIYRLDRDWYPVKKGDCIWMAPYCPQWFVAMGKEPAKYIYYKNVNRFPLAP